MKLCGNTTYTIFENNNFSIKTFKSMGSVTLPNGRATRNITIKGYFIPDSPIDLVLEGDFDLKPHVNEKGKKSYSFNVTSCKELKIPEQETIIKYLSSIKGIGDKLAKRIYKKFGDDTFEVLDNNIEELKNISGVGKKKYEIISRDYLSRGAARELFIYLTQFHVSNRRIEKIFNIHKIDALDKVHNHPYSLYLLNLLSFETADRIAKVNGHDLLSEERVQAAIIHALRNAESEGNTYVERKELLTNTAKILDVKCKSVEVYKKVCILVQDNIKKLDGVQVKILDCSGNILIQRLVTYKAEHGAESKAKLLLEKATSKPKDYSEDIKEAEKELGIKLSDEQKIAVEKAMNSNISIVTGGPGTGKTSFQKVLFYVFKRHFEQSQITLAAPTGRAARRMTEASGLIARTLHQTLGLMYDELNDIDNDNPEQISPGLLVVDEMSMIDIFLFSKLMKALTPATKAVFVGDVYQLPSVGCGAVLKDLIDSGKIPVTKFTKVFRQKAGSIIAVNAASINNGKTELEYGKEFYFLEENNSNKIQKYAYATYEKALNVFGVDETAVLTPFRKSTETGVNMLNPVLKNAYNPYPEKNTNFNKLTNDEIYLNDKVMYTRNTSVTDEDSGEDVLLTNGDIGYVSKIIIEDNVQIAIVDFDDDRRVRIMGDDLKNLVPAYSTTVHSATCSCLKRASVA